MEQYKVQIEFPGVGLDVANQYAQDLADIVKNSAGRNSPVEVDIVRTNPSAQDFGSALVLILGTTAVTSVAQGIRGWLIRNSGAKLEFKVDGEIIATNLESKDAAEIAWAISHRPK